MSLDSGDVRAEWRDLNRRARLFSDPFAFLETLSDAYLVQLYVVETLRRDSPSSWETIQETFLSRGAEVAGTDRVKIPSLPSLYWAEEKVVMPFSAARGQVLVVLAEEPLYGSWIFYLRGSTRAHQLLGYKDPEVVRGLRSKYNCLGDTWRLLRERWNDLQICSYI